MVTRSLTKTYKCYLFLLDDGSALCSQMMSSYSNSLAPGTLVNRRKQAEEYLKFSIMYKVPFLQPSVTQVCMFAQHLANIHAAPSSVKNYLSGAKTWVSEHCGAVHPFLSPQLAQLVKGFTKNSPHVPSRAPPLQPHHIRAICRLLDQSPSAPLAAKPAILMGYATFLRSSNLLSPTMEEWGGPHTLLASEVISTNDGLKICVRSTKTRSDSQGLTFFIPREDSPEFCPVVAWNRYKTLVRPWALGPAFVHMNRTPLTPAQLVKLMRLALQYFTDIPPGRVSMHSLRRGATQAAVDQGIPLKTVQARGTWKSSATMKTYLAP